MKTSKEPDFSAKAVVLILQKVAANGGAIPPRLTLEPVSTAGDGLVYQSETAISVWRNLEELGRQISWIETTTNSYSDWTSDSEAKARFGDLKALARQAANLSKKLDYGRAMVRGSIEMRGVDTLDLLASLSKVVNAALSERVYLVQNNLHNKAPMQPLATSNDMTYRRLAKIYESQGLGAPLIVYRDNKVEGPFVAFVQACFVSAGRPEPMPATVQKALDRAGRGNKSQRQI